MKKEGWNFSFLICDFFLPIKVVLFVHGILLYPLIIPMHGAKKESEEEIAWIGYFIKAAPEVSGTFISQNEA